jgi:hypothetical protein
MPSRSNKHLKRPRDVNQLAKAIVDKALVEESLKLANRENPDAVFTKSDRDRRPFC